MSNAIPSTLLSAADPLVLIDGAARITWLNESARTMLRAEAGSSLEQVFPPATVRSILATEHIAQLSLKGAPTSVLSNYHILVIDVAAPRPDSFALLLVIKPRAALRQELDSLISLTAHDLKNPLGAIFGYADALLDTTLAKEVPERVQGVLVRIRATAMRALELVRNFQFLATNPGGVSDAALPSGSPSPIGTELNALVNSVVEYSWRAHPELPTVTVVSAAEPLPVALDRTSLERVVANLVGNAIKYTPAKGTVRVTTERSSRGARLVVHNTDVSIPAPELPFIFERFRRGANSTGVPGSGLGLYIVQRIVESHGGTVTVESDPTRGTSFVVDLPLVPKQ